MEYCSACLNWYDCSLFTAMYEAAFDSMPTTVTDTIKQLKSVSLQ